MKKTIFIIIGIMLIIALITMMQISGYYNTEKYNEFILNKPAMMLNSAEEKILSLQQTYDNNDIKGIISIENTNFTTPVVQGKDNDYYLNHLPDKTYNINGSVFFDYRLNIDGDRKLIVYGHSSEVYDLPIEIIEDYINKSYWEGHKYIYLDTKNGTQKYQVASVYVETKDFDYMKLDFKSDYERGLHYQKLKNNSFYDTGVELLETDDILILQTCATIDGYEKYNEKYFLVIAKLVR